MSTPNVALITPGELRGNAPFAADDGRYVGTIDNLLIWDAARTEAELCATSGACD